MRDIQDLRLKVREMRDCYATADPLKEMSGLPGDEDTRLYFQATPAPRCLILYKYKPDLHGET